MPSFISQLITSKAVPGSGDHLHGPAGAHSPIASTATATTAASATPNGNSTTGLPAGFGGAGFGGLGGLGATGFGGLGGIGASPAGGLTGATRLPMRSNLGLPMGLQMPLTFPTNAPMGTNGAAPGVTPIIPMIPNMKRAASTRELKPRSSGPTVVDTRSTVSSSNNNNNSSSSSSDSAATIAAPSPPPSSTAKTTAPAATAPVTAPKPAPLPAAVAEPATDPAAPADDSSRMSWNDTQKMQDFFLHIKDPENFVQAENKLINIRELMAKNASPLERFEASQHAKDFSKKPSSGDDDDVSSSASTSASTSASASPVPAPSPMQDDRSASSPHSALADMLAARSGHAATPVKPERSNQDDNDRSPATDRTRSKNALAEMLAKRNGDTPQQKEPPQTPKKPKAAGDARGNMLAEMLAKRGGGRPQQPAPSTPVTKPKAAAPAGDARGNMLAEMLAKRGGGGEQPSPKPKPSGDARGNMLAEMLAKRGGGAPSAPATPEKTTLSSASSPSPLKKSEKSNPLLAMIAKRKASQPSPQSKGESAAANPLAAMLQRRMPPPGAGNPQESEHQAPPPSQQPPLSPSPAKSETTGAVALKDDPKYAQYFKMLKIGHPPPVVKHRMQRDGVDPAVLDFDPTKPLPSVLPGQSPEDAEAEREYQAQLAEYNEKVGKYTQMLKVGLPRPVVEHKMRMEGVDAAWLDGPPKKKVPVAAPRQPTEAEIALHREKYGKYFAMLRVGLPRGAVEHKMQMAGIDPKELDGPHPVAAPGASTAGSSPATSDAKSLKRTNSIRKKIHWEVKNHPAHKRTGSRDSLWNFPMVDDSLLGEIQVSRESKEMLEKLFVKDLTEEKARAKKLSGAKKPGSASPGDDAKKKQQLIVLIDMKKSQNIAITLARVKLSFPELKREILAMNPTVLSTAQLQSLMDMWPDRTEQQAIDNFRGDMNLLGSVRCCCSVVSRSLSALVTDSRRFLLLSCMTTDGEVPGRDAQRPSLQREARVPRVQAGVPHARARASVRPCV